MFFLPFSVAFSASLFPTVPGRVAKSPLWRLVKGIRMVDMKTSTIKETERQQGQSHTVASGSKQLHRQPVREYTRRAEIAPPAPAVPQPVRELARKLKKA